MRQGILGTILLCGVLAVTPLRAQDTTIVRPTTGGFIVDYQLADVRAVLDALADAAGLSISIGNIGNLRHTLRLSNPITAAEVPGVMQSIVESQGLQMTLTESGVYQVERVPTAARGRGNQPAAAASPTEMSVYVIPLRHLNNMTLTQILNGLWTTGGRGANFNFNQAGRQNQAGNRAGGAGAGAGGGGGRGRGGGGGGGGGDDDATNLDVLATAVQEQLALNPSNALTAIYDPATIAELVRAQQVQPDERRAAAREALVQQQQGGGGRGGRGADVVQGIGALLGNLQVQTAQGAAAAQQQNPVIVPTEGTNQIIVRATAADFAIIQALVQAIDLRPLQVLIEVSIVEVRRSEDLNVGVSGAGSYTRPGDDDPRVSGTLQRPSTFDNARDFILELTGGRGTVDFNIALNALAVRGDVTVASLPIIFAQNNRQASLVVGEQRPFVANTTLIPNDNGIVSQVIQYRDVATALLITPTINADGYVNMDVDQSIQNVTAEVQFDAPVISSRRAVTSLFIRSGQTAVIGGLTSNSVTRTRTGIPILSSIPIIGALFGATRNSDVVSEMYLFLTPHVIETDQDADRLTEAVRANSDLVKDVPLRQLIPQADPAIRVIIPPDTASLIRIPQVRPDTVNPPAGRGGRGGRGGVDTLAVRGPARPEALRQ
jgi:general secretion pathway protein D